MFTSGTLTAHFAATGDKLAFTAGTNQIIDLNAASAVITVQRQTSSGGAKTSGSTTVSLTSSSTGGTFYSNAACTSQYLITSITIGNGQSSANFWYKDSSTGSPQITASASGYASDFTTFSVNLRYSNFDGSNWLYGWTTGSQPPWYEGVGQGVGGTNCAKSDSGTPTNDGPFTCSSLDTSVGNTITITFMYKVLNTNSASDLRIAWSNAANPNLSPNSPDFNYVANIGTPGNTNWNTYTLTLDRSTTPSAFTTHFWFRFESNLSTHPGGVMESTWVDNVAITVS